MMTDPIADLLARIRNAGIARHVEASCPSSRIKLGIARVFEEKGFLRNVRVEARDGHPVIVMEIRYGTDGTALIDGMRRVSRPGRRVYVGAEKIPRIRRGLGVAILSTSRGVMADAEARAARVGGELLCEVW
jgi:small subunit ribosomal protein S8